MPKPPTTYFVSNDADVTYFYRNAVSQLDKDLENRKSLKDIAEKNGISIEFKKDGEYNKYKPKDNEIVIYDSSRGRHQAFFRHLRNAFSHCYINLQNGRCQLLDWNAYENRKKCKFALKRITMKGDVDYNSFKKTLDEFFDDKSIKPKKEKKNNKKKSE